MAPHLAGTELATLPAQTQELPRERKRTAGPRVPRHLAIILDGNGRWATAKGLPRLAGHVRGVEAVRETVAAALDFGVEHLSLYAFSSLNWQRPAEEVQGLMMLFKHYLDHEARRMASQGVRLRHIGERTRLPAEVVDALQDAEAHTASGARMTLHVAVNYGGREEIVHAVRTLAEEVAAGRMSADAIDAARLAGGLFTAGAPPVDLMVRTAGERRISNFLLWQSAYAELLFLDVLWPDFTRANLKDALDDFASRKRTFGGLVDRAEPDAAL